MNPKVRAETHVGMHVQCPLQTLKLSQTYFTSINFNKLPNVEDLCPQLLHGSRESKRRSL
jgi:hypothetical protein